MDNADAISAGSAEFFDSYSVQSFKTANDNARSVLSFRTARNDDELNDNAASVVSFKTARHDEEVDDTKTNAMTTVASPEMARLFARVPPERSCVRSIPRETPIVSRTASETIEVANAPHVFNDSNMFRDARDKIVWFNNHVANSASVSNNAGEASTIAADFVEATDQVSRTIPNPHSPLADSEEHGHLSTEDLNSNAALLHTTEVKNHGMPMKIFTTTQTHADITAAATTMKPLAINVHSVPSDFASSKVENLERYLDEKEREIEHIKQLKLQLTQAIVNNTKTQEQTTPLPTKLSPGALSQHHGDGGSKKEIDNNVRAELSETSKHELKQAVEKDNVVGGCISQQMLHPACSTENIDNEKSETSGSLELSNIMSDISSPSLFPKKVTTLEPHHEGPTQKAATTTLEVFEDNDSNDNANCEASTIYKEGDEPNHDQLESADSSIRSSMSSTDSSLEPFLDYSVDLEMPNHEDANRTEERSIGYDSEIVNREKKSIGDGDIAFENGNKLDSFFPSKPDLIKQRQIISTSIQSTSSMICEKNETTENAGSGEKEGNKCNADRNSVDKMEGNDGITEDEKENDRTIATEIEDHADVNSCESGEDKKYDIMASKQQLNDEKRKETATIDHRGDNSCESSDNMMRSKQQLHDEKIKGSKIEDRTDGNSCESGDGEKDDDERSKSSANAPKSTPRRKKNTAGTIQTNKPHFDLQNFSRYMKSASSIASSRFSSSTRSRVRAYAHSQAENTVIGGRSKLRLGESDLHPLLLVASIEEAHKGPIWTMKFSPSGKYLATGGKDGQILIWEVAPDSENEVHVGEERGDSSTDTNQEERIRETMNVDENVNKESLDHSGEEKTTNEATKTAYSPPPPMQGDGPAFGTEVKILSSKPMQRFSEHSADVINISWSKADDFLLSASLDKTVKLWHVSTSESFNTFQHSDFVTCVDFHPLDDQYFLSGCFDKKIRLWSIEDGRVRHWASAPDVVTAAKFTPTGKMAVVGLMKGQVYFYVAETLRYFTQISCKNRHGRKKYGRKVTGLHFRKITKEEDNKSIRPKKNTDATFRFTYQLLVTTNDSRMRLFGLDDFLMVSKFKGSTNESMQIQASFSETGDDVICGSQQGNVYIWNFPHSEAPLSSSKFTAHKRYHRNKKHDSFQASRANPPIVTDAIFAPAASVKCALLKSSLCPSLNNLDHIYFDMSSTMVLTSDYDGTIRVFIKKACLDKVLFEAGPDGLLHKCSPEE